MKTNLGTKLALGTMLAVALLTSGATTFVCHRYEQNSASDGHMLQMLDRMSEQQALGAVLTRLREGNVTAATALLNSRMVENASTINSLVITASDQYRPLAQAVAAAYRPLSSEVAQTQPSTAPPTD